MWRDEGVVMSAMCLLHGSPRTRRRTMSTPRRATRALIEAFLDGVSDLISVHDTSGNVVCVTPSVSRFIGEAATAKLYSTDALLVIHPDDRNSLSGAFQSWAGGGSAIGVVHYRARHRDGSWHDMEATGRSFHAENGDLRVGVTSRDRTASPYGGADASSRRQPR
jgi:sigma-B regulation protein RsbU (phosphoserine phosphatase)